MSYQLESRLTVCCVKPIWLHHYKAMGHCVMRPDRETDVNWINWIGIFYFLNTSTDKSLWEQNWPHNQHPWSMGALTSPAVLTLPSPTFLVMRVFVLNIKKIESMWHRLLNCFIWGETKYCCDINMWTRTYLRRMWLHKDSLHIPEASLQLSCVWTWRMPLWHDPDDLKFKLCLVPSSINSVLNNQLPKRKNPPWTGCWLCMKRFLKF